MDPRRWRLLAEREMDPRVVVNVLAEKEIGDERESEREGRRRLPCRERERSVVNGVLAERERVDVVLAERDR
jgi:hypothetical protein